jgi:hypothetical protein
MNQEIGKCISLLDVPFSLDTSMVWLKKSSIVEYIVNENYNYYMVSDGIDDYSVFLEDEFHKYFKPLLDFRNEKIDQIL